MLRRFMRLVYKIPRIPLILLLLLLILRDYGMKDRFMIDDDRSLDYLRGNSELNTESDE